MLNVSFGNLETSVSNKTNSFTSSSGSGNLLWMKISWKSWELKKCLLRKGYCLRLENWNFKSTIDSNIVFILHLLIFWVSYYRKQTKLTMASNCLKRKSLSSLNILHHLNGLSLTGYTPGAVQPLSLLSEERKSDPNDKLYDVDKVKPGLLLFQP